MCAIPIKWYRVWRASAIERRVLNLVGLDLARHVGDLIYKGE